MQLNNSRRFPYFSFLLWIAFIISSVTVLISCGDSNERGNRASQESAGESFTFFELGKTTRLTNSVRSDLREKLGRDAIERRSIIDLEINQKGFLNSHFPEIDRLNQELNFPPGERVEHNTVKLMYRYARKRNVPFGLVELLFSEYTNNPLLFKINFKIDEANTIETLQEKYGRPEIIDWGDQNGQSRFWRKSGDLLIVSRIPDRFGNIDHQIVIYFVENIEQLINTEKNKREAEEQQRVKTGKTAF